MRARSGGTASIARARAAGARRAGSDAGIVFATAGGHWRWTMADIVVRNNGGREVARREWEPSSWARELLRWDPFREMLPSFAVAEPTFNPAFEIKETKEGYMFKADLPGVVEKDIEITRTGNRLG
ncbi:MAG: Hsp20/alpha crystallin family protein, partial [Polyangia bacterium]